MSVNEQELVKVVEPQQDGFVPTPPQGMNPTVGEMEDSGIYNKWNHPIAAVSNPEAQNADSSTFLVDPNAVVDIFLFWSS